MKMTSVALAAALALALVGCGSDDGSVTAADAAPDTLADAGPGTDAAPDAADDAGPGVDSADTQPPEDTAQSDADAALADATADDTVEPSDAATPDAAVDADAGEPDTWVPPETLLVPVEGPVNITRAETGWYRGDLHYHTNHSEDAKKQGGDDLATCLAIADGYRHPAWLEGHPEREGNGLDFIAITDHRTDAFLSDPDYTHDHLILLGGEEYGGDGHANIWGLDAHITNDTQAEETANEHHLASMAEAHAQDALFSVNHPTQDNPWVWDTDGIDAIEVWNGPWGAFFGAMSPEELEGQVAGSGHENAFIRTALEQNAGAANDAALLFWYNHLTGGRHIPVVGGSDRHMLVPAALPTTYVRKTDAPEYEGVVGQPLGEAGILDGIRAGGTFVSRSVMGAQIDMVAEGPDGTLYPLGAKLPAGGKYLIHVTVSRAKGGMLRLVTGDVQDPVEGRYTANPTVLAEDWIPSDLAEATYEWEMPFFSSGHWLHAIVLEQLIVGPLPEELQATYDAIAVLPQGKAIAAVLEAMTPIVDPNVILNPLLCDPANWEPYKGQCMPIDTASLATFYMPDAVERLLNIYFVNGEPSEWCMGAITSAFMAVPPQ